MEYKSPQKGKYSRKRPETGLSPNQMKKIRTSPRDYVRRISLSSASPTTELLNGIENVTLDSPQSAPPCHSFVGSSLFPHSSQLGGESINAVFRPITPVDENESKSFDQQEILVLTPDSSLLDVHRAHNGLSSLSFHNLDNRVCPSTDVESETMSSARANNESRSTNTPISFNQHQRRVSRNLGDTEFADIDSPLQVDNHNNNDTNNEDTPLVRSKTCNSVFLTYPYLQQSTSWTRPSWMSNGQQQLHSTPPQASSLSMCLSEPPKRSRSVLKKPKPKPLNVNVNCVMRDTDRVQPQSCRHYRPNEEDDPQPALLPVFILSNCEVPGLRGCTISTLVELVECPKIKFDELYIIDCRYDYEYEAGHIKGALNINTKAQIESLFFKSLEQVMDKRILVIFHCEYSQLRGPTICNYVRRRDRTLMGIEGFPKVYYPDLYVLEGGYRGFRSVCPRLCTNNGAYRRMCDAEFVSKCVDAKRRWKQQCWAKALSSDTPPTDSVARPPHASPISPLRLTK